MKKSIQFIIAIALVLTIVGVALNSPAWAKLLTESTNSTENDTSIQEPAALAPESSEITITESGTYIVGGICMIEVTYNLDSGLKNTVDTDVPPDFSSDIPFGYEGDLFLPGCHVVHYKNDEIMGVMSAEDGSWEVCFAERPDVELTIYYYQDEPFTDNQFWIELQTVQKNGMACANAIYTGEYAPGTKVDAVLNFSTEEIPTDLDAGGTVLPPPVAAIISESGFYSVGGICTFTVLYREPFQANEIQVADALRHDNYPIYTYDYSEHDIFPENQGLIYYPGCHVLHYDRGEITRWEKFVDQGDWIICFAEMPDKEMTIYYYLGDTEDQESSWIPLETTVSGGEACAPAFFTGVYVPTGKDKEPDE